jgi:hypothetical protein
MPLVDRVRVTFNLMLATYISLVDCAFPGLCPGTTYHLVKKVGTLIDNGLQCGSGVCSEVSAATGESCVVDETGDVVAE